MLAQSHIAHKARPSNSTNAVRGLGFFDGRFLFTKEIGVKMSIDPRKVSLSERDLEDWLFENPTAIRSFVSGKPIVTRWIARQYHVPSGIIDLLGINEEHGVPVIVEMKNVPTPKPEHLTQLIRYHSDIVSALELSSEEFDEPQVLMFLIGPFTSIPNDTLMEAEALNISVRSVDFSISAEISGDFIFSKEFREEFRNGIAKLAEDQPIRYALSTKVAADAIRNALVKSVDSDPETGDEECPEE